MTRIAVPIVAVALACALSITPAHANRTFVSGSGNDANPCSITAPCRTLQAAFNVTTSGGEIEVLDPTGYGTLTITHAVVIEGHGWASMNPAAAGGAVITINAGASDKISLRGLVVDGFGITTALGIVFNSGGTLDIRDCVIRRTNTAIKFAPAAAADLLVTNTRVAFNNSGIIIQVGSGSVTGALSRVWIEGNNNAFLVVGGNQASNVSVSDSEISGNTNGAQVTSENSGIMTQLTVRNSNISNNTGNGLIAQNVGALLLVSRSTITGNAFGFVTFTGGVIESYVDNNLVGNTTSDGTPGSQLTYQ